MFTGLIVELGEVTALDKKSASARLTVKGNEVVKDAAIGDSISINGVCLTVTELAVNNNSLSFDVSYETLKNTNLGILKKGDRVNLEPSLRPTSKMGGHFVTGHVEAVGRIMSITPVGNALKIMIEAPESVLNYLIEKGSVAVDGISLTVVDVLKDSLSIVIIPHTAGMTTIGFKKPGDTVNLEPDILAKYVAKFVKPDKDRDSSILAALRQSGFVQ